MEASLISSGPAWLKSNIVFYMQYHYMFSLYEGSLIPWKCMFENVLVVYKIEKLKHINCNNYDPKHKHQGKDAYNSQKVHSPFFFFFRYR